MPLCAVCITVTDIAESLQTRSELPTRKPRVWPILVAGPFAGLALGIAARVWMRVISDDPEFSWSGTIFILAAFTLCGVTQSVAIATRRRARRRWTLTIARVVGVIGLFPLFTGAGSVMLPTVIAGGLAYARTDWSRIARVVCLAVAMLPVLFVAKDLVDSFGWSVHTLLGFAGLLAVYGTIVVAARSTFAPQLDGWRLPRWAMVIVVMLICVPVLMLMAGRVFT